MSKADGSDRSAAPAVPARCPRCGVIVDDDRASQCWLCKEPLTTGEPGRLDPANVPGKPGRMQAPEPVRGRWTSHIGSLMLVVAFIAIELGIAREAPGLALLLAITLGLILLSPTPQQAAFKDREPSTPAKHALVIVRVLHAVITFSAVVFVSLVAALLVMCSVCTIMA